MLVLWGTPLAANLKRFCLHNLLDGRKNLPSKIFLILACYNT
ncbi:hypothetical protein ASZ90_012535 [hydrocarbon metagenome]|uniref:Uncharacterized protein n=1 Tax=hydrocarbon metagenome TaxID=938273 RepID=A0A0W8FAY4_9ZZZZ